VIAGILTVLWIAPCLYFLDDMALRRPPLYRRDYSLSGIDISIVSERGLPTALFWFTWGRLHYMIMNANGILVVRPTLLVRFCGSVQDMLAVGPRRPERPPAETQTVTYQQTQNPEGGTTVDRVSVVKGTVVPKEDMISPSAPKEESTSPDLVI
jgi:hypothetical protein